MASRRSCLPPRSALIQSAAAAACLSRPQLQRSLASEREAREAAYQERSLIQIELEAKQRRFDHALDSARAQAEQAAAALAAAEQLRAEAEARCREATEALQAERGRLAELQVSESLGSSCCGSCWRSGRCSAADVRGGWEPMGCCMAGHSLHPCSWT